jgi:pimeloyl-ACP methyl ester carboxylesterase
VVSTASRPPAAIESVVVAGFVSPPHVHDTCRASLATPRPSLDLGRRVLAEPREHCPPQQNSPFTQLNPASQTRAGTKNPERGPLLVVSGERDHTVPRAISHAAYRRQRKNPAATDFVEIPGRGHSLVFDSGWAEVADAALDFLDRQGMRAS